MALNLELLPNKPKQGLNLDLLPNKPTEDRPTFGEITRNKMNLPAPIESAISAAIDFPVLTSAHFANQLALDYPRRLTEKLAPEAVDIFGNKPNENVLGLMRRRPVVGTASALAGMAGGIM